MMQAYWQTQTCQPFRTWWTTNAEIPLLVLGNCFWINGIIHIYSIKQHNFFTKNVMNYPTSAYLQPSNCECKFAKFH